MAMMQARVIPKEDASSLNSEEIVGDNEEEEEQYFQDISLLIDRGISVDDINKLKAVSINTIKGVQMTTKKRLLEIEGFNEKKVQCIQEACAKTPCCEFTTALEVLDQRRQIFKLSTGSKSFDQLLGGGIESMSISEVFGEFGTGKTQIAHTLCVTAQMPGPNGYTGGKVMFIDTENTFRPEKFQAIADRYNLDVSSVLGNIMYSRAYTSDHQCQLLNNVSNMLHEDAGLFKLLIVDSVMALFRVDFSGVGEINARQRNIAQFMSRLKKISEEYNIAILITNQVTSEFSRNNEFVEVHRPVGGHVLAHASTVRISLHKSNDSHNRMAKIFDSPNLPRSETQFAITSAGIDDYSSME